MKVLERAIVKVSACGIYAKPTFKSEMVNQALIKEEVSIIDKTDNWYKISLKHDGYKGWVHEMYFCDQNNHKDSIEFDSDKNMIVKHAIDRLGTPYLWGGMSNQGYDCSGLVQTCMNLSGFKFPRDVKDQLQSPLLDDVEIDKIHLGDLLFFEENNIPTHVGIAISDFNFLKAKGYHGKMIHASGTVKISEIASDNKIEIIIDRKKDKKIKLYKAMRLKNDK